MSAGRPPTARPGSRPCCRARAGSRSGGALANDVHGKNHHREGSFGCHVPGFTLLRGDGRVLACSALDNPELYRATIGGLGLTGLVLDLKLRLRRVPGLMLAVEGIRPGPLREVYALPAQSRTGGGG